MDLATIRTVVDRGNFSTLKRSLDVDNLYNLYRTEILNRWVSIEDLVKSKFFGASVARNSQGLLYSYFGREINNGPIYSLEPNEYPYDLGKNIKHMVLWASEPLEKDKVEEILKQEFKQLNNVVKDYFWFEQTVEQKSVKGIWHIHVFIES
jgi:hypothetical protein